MPLDLKLEGQPDPLPLTGFHQDPWVRLSLRLLEDILKVVFMGTRREENVLLGRETAPVDLLDPLDMAQFFLGQYFKDRLSEIGFRFFSCLKEELSAVDLESNGLLQRLLNSALFHPLQPFSTDSSSNFTFPTGRSSSINRGILSPSAVYQIRMIPSFSPKVEKEGADSRRTASTFPYFFDFTFSWFA